MKLSGKTVLLSTVMIAALGVAGCGRKGNLDRPGSTAPINTRAPADMAGAPAVAAGEPTRKAQKADEKSGIPERPFLLDPLL